MWPTHDTSQIRIYQAKNKSKAKPNFKGKRNWKETKQEQSLQEKCA